MRDCAFRASEPLVTSHCIFDTTQMHHKERMLLLKGNNPFLRSAAFQLPFVVTSVVCHCSTKSKYPQGVVRARLSVTSSSSQFERCPPRETCPNPALRMLLLPGCDCSHFLNVAVLPGRSECIRLAPLGPSALIRAAYGSNTFFFPWAWLLALAVAAVLCACKTDWALL